MHSIQHTLASRESYSSQEFTFLMEFSKNLLNENTHLKIFAAFEDALFECFDFVARQI